MFTIFQNGALALNGRRLDTRAWRLGEIAGGGHPVGPREAFGALAERVGLRHLVLGIIGPREASAAQLAAARGIGSALGEFGLTLICGGKGGVMAAASEGCAEAGGLMIGILPGMAPENANPHVAIPLPTGLSEGRNMVIARAARVLVAVGGSYGTLSEVAYGLHFGKPVIGCEGAPDVAGVRRAPGAEAAVDLALTALAEGAAG